MKVRKTDAQCSHTRAGDAAVMAESHNDFFVRELTDALSTLRDGRVTLPEAPKKNGKMQLQNGEASKRYTVDL